jgi:hypothetical protein
MTLRDELLPLIDDLRGIAGDLGMHRFQVWVRTVTWSGARIGLGNKTTTDTRLLVGGQDPKVKVLKDESIVAGADDLQGAEFEIGPLTPSFGTGGYTLDTLDPSQSSTPTQYYFLLKGPGLPTNGLLCQKTQDDVGKPLRYVFRVRSIGRTTT